MAVQLFALEQSVDVELAHIVGSEHVVVTVSDPEPTSGACALTHD